MGKQRSGRPEKPIDARNGPAADFAEELRRLRKKADLTVQELAQRAHCATGSISSAASGRVLPSWQITRAYITGCGEDPATWRERWEAAAAGVGMLPDPERDGDGVFTDQDGRAGTTLPDAPSLASIAGPQDFHLALLALRAQKGSPSLRELSILARNAGYMLPRSTLADALNRAARLPSMEVVEAVLAACDVPATERDAWRWAWSRTAYLQQRQTLPVAERWQDSCPYPGLAPFDEDSTEVFYGRDKMTAQLVSRLNETLVGTSMLAVIGPSGAGKSSLLRAGLVPAAVRSGLAAPGSGTWPTLIMTPGSDPLETLAGHLGRIAQISSDALLDQLRKEPSQAGAIAAAVAEQSLTISEPVQEPGAMPARLLVIVDQFEELFVLGREKTRQEFITALVSLASPLAPAENAPAVVVLGLRSDFFASCADYPPLTPVLEHSFLVGSMTEAELRIAITAPAATAGLSIEEGLTDVLLGDLRSPEEGERYGAGMLPLLAHALQQTWERREGTLLTRRAYANTGGVAGALATSADAAYNSLPPSQQAAAQAVLLHLVGISEEGIQVRRRVPREALDLVEGSRDVLQAFAAARLITVDQDTVQFTHEALLRAWPQLEAWINESRVRLLAVQEVTEVAYAWQRSGRDSAFLYAGSRLLSIRRTLQDTEKLSPVVRAFLSASARMQNQRVRLRMSALLGLTLLVVMATLAATIAAWQASQAEQEKNSSQHALSLYQKAQAEQLDRNPIRVTLSVDSQALLGNSPTAIASVRSEVARITALANKHAGLVLAFGGSTDGNYAQAVQVASVVNHALTTSVGNETFTNAAFEDFAAPGQPSDVVKLDIYLFKGP